MKRRVCANIDENLYQRFKMLASMKYKFEKGFSQKSFEEALIKWVEEQEEIFLVKKETKSVLGNWIKSQESGD